MVEWVKHTRGSMKLKLAENLILKPLFDGGLFVKQMDGIETPHIIVVDSIFRPFFLFKWV